MLMPEEDLNKDRGTKKIRLVNQMHKKCNEFFITKINYLTKYSVPMQVRFDSIRT